MAIVLIAVGAYVVHRHGSSRHSVAVSPKPSTSTRPTAVASPRPKTPLTGVKFWRDSTSAAAKQQATWERDGHADQATALGKITSQPFAVWLAGNSDTTRAKLGAALSGSAADGTVPLFVVYDIPDRDCGGFSSGGAPSVDIYLSWLNSVSAAVASRRVVVVLEPDAVANAVKGCAGTTPDRVYALLAQAVQILKHGAHTAVYIDAGNPRFVVDPAQLVVPLQRSGIANADGFALNVANFQTTASNIGYGRQLSSALGASHFVIDVSRNGAGPLPAGASYAGPSWCNPPGRRLGQPPTADTGSAIVDALLWIKRPGESDGDCGVGDPPAGQWWPDYALSLAAG